MGEVIAALKTVALLTAVSTSRSPVAWLWLVDGQRPDRWDVLGAFVSVLGMAIIAFGPRS